MKGKMTIVLLSLVLVFGMIAASCDDGGYKSDPYPAKTQDPNNPRYADDYTPSFADPSVDKTFVQAEGMTTGITPKGSATFAKGVIDLTGSNGPAFIVAAPGADEDSIITIKYIAQLKSGTDARLTLKNGEGYGDLLESNSADCNWYPTLKLGEPAKLVLQGSWYDDPAKGIMFQRNDYPLQGLFQIKILSVTVK